MRHETCPKCEGSLVVPDKKRGKSVQCPVCGTKFIASVDSKAAKKKRQTNLAAEKPIKPSMRSIPVPSAIKEEVVESQPASTSAGSSKVAKKSALDPPDKSRLSAPGPPSAPRRSSTKTTSSNQSQVAASATKAPTKKVPVKPVARIIEAAPALPQLTTEGQLPSLQLMDDKPPEKESKLAENPAFLGLLVCGSIVVSTLMLLLASYAPEVKNDNIETARVEIREFYEVKPGDEAKLYQVELREAQLSHSRGDHQSEVRAYQRLMRRFRSEDRNQFAGVTGSPTWDAELQELVSTLLNEAKRLSKANR